MHPNQLPGADAAPGAALEESVPTNPSTQEFFPFILHVGPREVYIFAELSNCSLSATSR